MNTSAPSELFKQWYDEALNLDINYPDAMTLATADASGRPSCRIILLKEWEEDCFYFFTNLTSHKGKELHENPYAALCFYWRESEKQIRIEGKIERVSEARADAYFASRPRESQIGAWASKQSSVMEKAEDLPNRLKELTKDFEGGPIPRPPFWSGYCLTADRYEFWKEQPFRLHTRLAYEKEAGGWQSKRLYP